MASATYPLTDEEIQKFWEDLDLNRDGTLSFAELEKKLEAVHEGLVPKPQKHNLNHPDRANPKSEKPHSSDLHDFLCSFMPGCGESISKEDFIEQVKSWNIPSQDQSDRTEKDDAAEAEKKLPFSRRLKAWWSVKGPEVAFLVFVGLLMLGMGLWQFIYYLRNAPARAALGWGVVTAKLAAGVLYPSLFFMTLSMSRWFAMFCRKSYLLSRAVNWDYSQAFHIKMSIITIFFACLHAIGHLTGSFLTGSRPERQEALAAILGADAVPKSYAAFVRSRPGWTGLTALISFLLIGATSQPRIRKWNYEFFQAVHLLMYLAFAMLAMHGTAKLLQAPMMGYWLVFPVLLVLAERLNRLYRAFASYPARLEALDDGTVVITAEKPEGKVWHARAGQYVFVQVPALSRLEFHPFTISACVGSRLQVHIKADGDWTEKLHKLAMSGKGSGDDDFLSISVGIDGPFGAPAQRFYTFEKAIIVGAGIGVTPFSAIITDLLENFKSKGDPWQLTRSRSFSRKAQRSLARTPSTSSITPVNTQELSTIPDAAPQNRKKIEEKRHPDVQAIRRSKPGSYGVRRVDFHWSVKDKNDLRWFSDLLNRASALSEENLESHLTLNINAHVTAKRKNISTHVFRYLLDSYRPKDFPYSALTGLRAPSHFGRPDFPAIMEEFYQDMKAQGWHGRVGVFFCGPPVIGEVLADLCSELTARARHEGYGMRFMMQIEVFN